MSDNKGEFEFGSFSINNDMLCEILREIDKVNGDAKCMIAYLDYLAKKREEGKL